MELLNEFVVGFEDKFKFAAEFAKKKHEDTYAIRRSTFNPYWTHIQQISELARAYGGTDDEVIASILHDTEEDTPTSSKELEVLFGKTIAHIVDELTNNRKEIEEVGKEKYISEKLLKLSDSAFFVKLCDIFANSQDYPTPAQAERMYNNLLYIKDKREMSGKIKDLYEDVLSYLDSYISNNKNL